MTVLPSSSTKIATRIQGDYSRYLELATESAVVEWSNGEVIIMPPPSTTHQKLINFLSTLLTLFVEHFAYGAVFDAPLETRLWPDGPARQPDILYISNAQQGQITGQRFEGAPELVVEVISPGSVREDRVKKFREYEKAGVKEYWLIDYRPLQKSVELYRLNEQGEFADISPDQANRLHSAVLPGFWFDLNWMHNDLPNAQQGFAQIMLTQQSLAPEELAYFQYLLGRA